LTIDKTSSVASVTFDDCSFTGLRILDEQAGEIDRQYAPTLVRSRLIEAGFGFADDINAQLPLEAYEESPTYKLMHRLLRMFYRSTAVGEPALRNRFHSDFNHVVTHVIPLLESYGIVEERHWRGSGNQRIWGLNTGLDQVFGDEEPGSTGKYSDLWRDVSRAGLDGRQ
jgi:hypothetical protein